jgi:hypothetical protein
MGFSLISEWWEENPSSKPPFRVPFTFSKLQNDARNGFRGTWQGTCPDEVAIAVGHRAQGQD